MDAINLTWEDEDDEIVHADLPITIPFKWVDTDEVDSEQFLARGTIPFGAMLNLEDQRPGALYGLFAAAFYDDDNERDEQTGEPIPGTSSLERWRKLADDPNRRVAGRVLSELFQALGTEYSTRSGLRAAPQRPTTRVAPSRAQRRANGRTSTAAQPARALRSADSQQG